LVGGVSARRNGKEHGDIEYAVSWGKKKGGHGALYKESEWAELGLVAHSRKTKKGTSVKRTEWDQEITEGKEGGNAKTTQARIKQLWIFSGWQSTRVIS